MKTCEIKWHLEVKNYCLKLYIGEVPVRVREGGTGYKTCHISSSCLVEDKKKRWRDVDVTKISPERILNLTWKASEK